MYVASLFSNLLSSFFDVFSSVVVFFPLLGFWNNPVSFATISFCGYPNAGVSISAIISETLVLSI